MELKPEVKEALAKADEIIIAYKVDGQAYTFLNCSSKFLRFAVVELIKRDMGNKKFSQILKMKGDYKNV